MCIRFTLGILLVILACQVSRLEAATFTVNPMQVVFTPARKSAVVTLKNTSKEEMRFQVSVFSWDQTARGEMLLGETRDVVFFPQLLVLGPGQQRPIRLGITGSVGATEKAYRIFFTELPKADRPATAVANGVQMRVKVGLPVFVSPASRGTALVAIRNSRYTGGHATFQVENSGMTHVVVDAIRVRGLDGARRQLFERTIKGWYLLARHSTEYDVPLGDAACTASSLAIEVLIGKTVVRDQILPPLADCR